MSHLPRVHFGKVLPSLDGPYAPERASQEHTESWWKVMCLTGVDYFSTLGYQPGIAFLAAGAVSPLATLVLVLVTLFAALPTYAIVAARSPHGEGSISMLERYFGWWKGKLFVLALLGFAATDFIITMTLSASDAAAHMSENPLAPLWLEYRVYVSVILIVLLGAVFWKGFHEAIGLAMTLVASYLSLNLIVISVSFVELFRNPDLVGAWWLRVFEENPEPWRLVLVLVLVFPRLALGLSGFETGVAVMPLVKGHDSDTVERPHGRIHNTRKLLASAAALMSFYLLASSFVTTTLIPSQEFRSGGEANGRALSYLAHHLLGHHFGTVYDAVTISILWFAGASAMAGLLNLVPRYLPRFGMAPEWTRQRRPLVVIFTVAAAVVVVLFQADVDAQGGAYATGVLALMTSAAIAVTLSSAGFQRIFFFGISAVFCYTTIANVWERPDGLKIALCFIAAIVFSSVISRLYRSTELRVGEVVLDEKAEKILGELPEKVRLVALHPGRKTADQYLAKVREQTDLHGIPSSDPLLFLEVTITDASNFGETLKVSGQMVDGHRVFRTSCPAVPNAIAAILLTIRELKGIPPHGYFGWREGNPLLFILAYLAFGQGDIAPLTREVLRRAEPDVEQRPRIHVG